MAVPSLRGRLMRMIMLVVPLVWLVATGLSGYAAWHEVNELYDNQQRLFARQLLYSTPAIARPVAPPGPGSDAVDGMALALWDAHGELMLHDGEGLNLSPHPGFSGFLTLEAEGKQWRVYYLSANARTVAVAMERKERWEVVRGLLAAQWLPWLLMVPVLLILLWRSVARGLAPLERVREELQHRTPDDPTPLSRAVPSELTPLIDGMNGLIARGAEMLSRERRFTADAAHELRTPLAALRVQAEVAQLSTTTQARQHALGQLTLGIDRATRLTEQLLALSRLDPLQTPAHLAPLRWQAIAARALEEARRVAAEHGIGVELQQSVPDAEVLPLSGDETLVGLLLRNLLDNAIRYSPDGATVTLVLAADHVAVRDTGPGISAEWLERVRERFFRPPGQSQPGSGLGLSIVERVAELHGLALQLENHPEGGLVARLVRA
ncbi:ATP-binding protein [Pseudogulbenkiania subflava]|uniref:histidine kinase n=1 Tax=Pseudogulbenkiania subflava DSM 22618 TaxID=1123014 RepID=A0A1Y6BAK9_9NEIS|nr:ATP-binding protein [Pseudogulbenkiania subflava]SMF01542.1 two-component system, OmpR family, sensor histidine kinase QseC [Pseudogulbenkiania subflava DSM 22618]